MANITAYPTYISVTAPTDFEAFSAIFDEIAKAGGDWKVEGPFGVGILNGAIVTGRGYLARREPTPVE